MTSDRKTNGKHETSPSVVRREKRDNLIAAAFAGVSTSDAKKADTDRELRERAGRGPAFPSAQEYIPSDGGWRTQDGMTLRDYFAAHAPPPPKWWMDGYAKDAQDLDTVADTLGQWNYVYADSMLKARKS